MRKVFLAILSVLLLVVVGFAGTLSGLYDIPVTVEKVIERPVEDTPIEEETGEEEKIEEPSESEDITDETQVEEAAMLSDEQEIIDKTEDETMEDEGGVTEPETPSENPDETPVETPELPDETEPDATPTNPEVPEKEYEQKALGLYLTEKLHFTGFLNAVGEGLYKSIFYFISVFAAIGLGVSTVFLFKRKKKAPKNPNPPVYPPHYQERKGPEAVPAPKENKPRRGVKF